MTSQGKAHRRTQLSVEIWIAIVAISVIGHAGVIGLVQWDSAVITPAEPVEEEPETEPSLVSYSCELEAAAATGVAMGICASPFGGDRGACAADAAREYRLAYLECKREPEEVTVTMIDLDKINPIPILPIEPIDDVVAAQLLEEQVLEKIEQEQKRVEQPKATGQVVEITKPELESRPERARFVSEFDSQAKKEVVARGSTEEMVEAPAPREIPVAPEPTPLPEEITKIPEEATTETSKDPSESPGEKSESPAPTSALAMRGVGEAPEAPSEAREAGDRQGTEEITSDGVDTRRGDGARRSEKTELEPEGSGGGDGGDGKPTAPDLRPSDETLARAVGGGSVDKLDNVESGDFTALNSRKWKYASFFNRLKRRVAQSWHPDKVYLRRDPTGKVYGTKDRVTVLKVSLTPDGALAKVYIAKQSGIDFLDDEAVRAFNEAGPFPNPPGALVEDGLITFSFGFHFQIGGRKDRWRVFRYR